MNPPALVHFDGPSSLARKAAAFFLEQASALPTGRFLTALSGGRIARLFFDELVRQTKVGPQNLARVEFFWADERCVPPTDPESNFGLAQRHLFEPLRIPLEQTHRVRGEIPPESAASLAEDELLGAAFTSPAGLPFLDLVILGMGEDGHIASLFPGEPDEQVQSMRAYRIVVGPKPPPRRITMTYAVLAAAREVLVLASGPRKEAALRRSLESPPATPLGRLLTMRQDTWIYTDIKR